MQGIGRFFTVCLLIGQLASFLLVFLLHTEASGFELFGWRPFGSTAQESDLLADSVFYKVDFKLAGADRRLEKKIKRSSLFYAKRKEPPAGTVGLLVRAQSEQERLAATLYEEGYYGSHIQIFFNGRPFETVRPTDTLNGTKSEPISVEIRIAVGPLFFFTPPIFEIMGAGERPTEAQLISISGLHTGAVARSTQILEAERKLLAFFQNRGFALAKIQERSVVADHATRRVTPRLSFDTGPIVRFGKVEVMGTAQLRPEVVQRVADIPEGEIVRPKLMRAVTQRLQALGILNSVSVRLAQSTEEGTEIVVPVQIEVTERKPRFVGASTYWSSLDGASGSLFWGHRNLFGGAESLRIEASFSNLLQESVDSLSYGVSAKFRKPAALSPKTDFTLDLTFAHENPDSYESQSTALLAQLDHRFSEKTRGTIGGEIGYTRSEDAYGDNRYFFIGLPLAVYYDGRNQLYDPSRGIQGLLKGTPTYDLHQQAVYLRTEGMLAAYHALDKQKRLILAGRLQIGSVLGASAVDIPSDQRFLVGGGGSIRGYDYESVGPESLSEDTPSPVPGRSFVALSAETRLRLSKAWGLVGFVDAGMAYTSQIPNFSDSLKVGVGVGVRYYTRIGPVRFDLAFPLNRTEDASKFAVYLGLGQSF